MKSRIVFNSLLLFLCFFVSRGYSDDKSTTTEDMFGLKMEVIAPYPDVLNDGVDMDTVLYNHIISVKIHYKNRTSITQRDFEISTFFPNRFESYTKLISWSLRPDYVDHPDSSIQASWKLGDLAPSDSGIIEYSLLANRAPKDTIYLSYETVAKARWTPVSQVSHTNIYVPAGVGLAPYPNLWIDKIDNAETIFPGDTIIYTLRYGNSGPPTSPPAEAVAIFDTLPSYVTILEDQYTPPIDTLPDGRLLIVWHLEHIVPYSYSDSLILRVIINLVTDQDSIMYNSALITSFKSNELMLGDNRDREPVQIKPKIDLAIEQVGSPSYSLFPDDAQSFALKCTNLSSLDLDSIRMKITIDDSVPGSNIYTIQDFGGGQSDSGESYIHWDIFNLPSQQSISKNFRVAFDKAQKSTNYTINFQTEVDTVVLLRDGLHSDGNLSNNFDQWVVQIDGTPDLSIDLTELNNKTTAMPNSVLNFSVTCHNASNSADDSIDTWIRFSGDPIFTITNTDGNVTDNSLIIWKIPPLLYQQSLTKTFDLTIDRISNPGSFNIHIIAAIDTLEINPQFFADNMDTWDVSATATPLVTIGPISTSPATLTLSRTYEYTIPYSNNGNFPATNSVMTIERPDFTYMLYYIHDNSTNYLEDSTVATIQIPLGDLEPDSEESIVVGLRIYSFKQLPANLSSPLNLVFKSTITYDLGEVTASRVDDVPFVFIASLILDKNIVEPDKLPLKITFKSSDFGNVDIKIYNLAGEFIKTVYMGPVEKGDTYIYDWDGLNEQGSSVSSGVYFVYAVSKFYNGYKKVVIVK
jgi:uncharacterized repeat protein (TIGR01451 family)